MDVLKYLFYILLIIGLPLSELARISFGQVATTLMDVLVLLIVGTFFVLKGRFMQKEELIKPISLFVLSLILSLILNIPRLSLPQLLVSSSYIVRWASYASIYFVIRQFDLPFKQKINFLLIVSGGIIVLFGFLQYFLYPDLRNLFYLGWDEHLYRFFSWTFFDPNFAGIFLVLYFIFLLFQKEIKKILIVTLEGFTLISILLTYSRSAYLSLVIGLISYFIIFKRFKQALITIASFSILFIAISKVPAYSEGTNLLRTASSLARFDSAKKALTIFRDNAIFGVGFDAYRYAQERYGYINESKRLIHSGAGTDNSFLFILATAGIIGFLAYIFLLYKLFSLGSNFLALSIIVVLLDSLFINSFFYPPIMLWIWILAGIRENN